MPAAPSAAELASRLLDTTMQVLCTIRSELRAGSDPDLTMAQFRALLRLHKEPGTSLSELADDMGVSPPAMSKLIDGLVERDLAVRETQAADRRRVGLAASPRGKVALDRVRGAVRDRIALRLTRMGAESRSGLFAALHELDACLAAVAVPA